MINIADAIYVLGKLVDRNREVTFVADGESTDLPSGAIYAYNSTFTKFPYSENIM